MYEKSSKRDGNENLGQITYIDTMYVTCPKFSLYTCTCIGFIGLVRWTLNSMTEYVAFFPYMQDTEYTKKDLSIQCIQYVMFVTLYMCLLLQEEHILHFKETQWVFSSDARKTLVLFAVFLFFVIYFKIFSLLIIFFMLKSIIVDES